MKNWNRQVLKRETLSVCTDLNLIITNKGEFKTSKQRAYLKSIAMTTEPILQIGKSSLTPEFTQSAKEALEARELIKISVLQNCMDDPKEIARVLAERTGSQVVQVIGKKIVLYKEGKKEKKKIQLP